MDLKNNEIIPLSDLDDLVKAGRNRSEFVPLTEHQAKTMKNMPKIKRKGYMRNQPCVCGSGRKFKKCCWNNYSVR